MKWLSWLKNVLLGQDGSTKSLARTSVKPRSVTTGMKFTSDDYRKLMDLEEKSIMRINDTISSLEEQRAVHEARYNTYCHMYSVKIEKEKV